MLRKDCWFNKKCSQSLQECPTICKEYEHMKDMFIKSNLKESQWYKYEFEPIREDLNAYKKLTEIIKNDLERWSHKFHSLYIWSHNYWNGKTTFSIKILQNYMLQWLDYTFTEYPCAYFISSIQIKDLFKNQVNNREEFDRVTNILKKTELLIIDDVDLLVGDEKLETYLAGIINERYNSQKSIIYTSHLSPQELEDKTPSDYLDSRLIGLSDYIEFRAPSYKVNKAGGTN